MVTQSKYKDFIIMMAYLYPIYCACCLAIRLVTMVRRGLSSSNPICFPRVFGGAANVLEFLLRRRGVIGSMLGSKTRSFFDFPFVRGVFSEISSGSISSIASDFFDLVDRLISLSRAILRLLERIEGVDTDAMADSEFSSISPELLESILRLFSESFLILSELLTGSADSSWRAMFLGGLPCFLVDFGFGASAKGD